MKLRPVMPSSEHQLQKQLASFLEVAARPEIIWTAIPNGGKRHIRIAVRLKEEGTKRGTPDLMFLLEGGKAAFLEMKIKGGSLSSDQRAFRDKAKALGHAWGMAKTMDQAVEFLRDIGALKAGTQLQ